MKATAREMNVNPGCNFVVKFSNNKTNGVLPRSLGGKRREPADATEDIFLGLTTDTWGVENKWVVLECPVGYSYSSVSKKKGKGAAKPKPTKGK